MDRSVTDHRMSQALDDFIHEPRIAYFSMEIAFHNEIPTFSGGLGILAGDTLRSAADLELPFVAVSLVSTSGYFHQSLDEEGNQTEHPDQWDPASWCTPLGAKIAVTIGGRPVWIRGWLYVEKSHTGGREPVLLLDTDLPENHEQDRTITATLYGGDMVCRLKQEIVLGFGGVRMLHALGFHVRQYHMNEGHSAFLLLQLLKQHTYPRHQVRAGESRYDFHQVREMCNFTTHTPVEAGHDKFPYELATRYLDEFPDFATIRSLAGSDRLNMTRLALNLSEYVNGVAKRHAETSRKLFPEYKVNVITNGIHVPTWAGPAMSALFEEYIPGWFFEPELLISADRIPDEGILTAHRAQKLQLLERVQELTGRELSPDVMTLGFARRMTAYKRPDLIFSDLERLRQIARKRPFQLLMAGKAHPRDEGGKRMIRLIHQYARQLGDEVPVVFIPNYDMSVALRLVTGVDLWLNTPQPPQEASGTSGMKAALNGVPNFSVLDGWWLEGHIEDVTGWSIGCDDGVRESPGGDASDLYDKLENHISPLFYDDQPGWTAVMKGAISRNGAFFNSHRMLRRYTSDAYIR